MTMTQRQIDFEKQAHVDAINQLERDLTKAKQKSYFSSTLQARETIKHLLIPMSDDLLIFVENIAKGRSTTTADAAFAPELMEYLRFINAEHITVVLLKSILDLYGAFDKPTMSRVSNFIGSRLEDELRFRFYELTAPKEVVDAAWKRVREKGSTPKYRRLATKLITEKIIDGEYPGTDKWPEWSGFYRCGMGLLLLTFAYRFGLIRFQVKQEGKKKSKYVFLSDEYIQLHDQIYEDLKDVAYLKRPLIEPPLHWQHQPGPATKNTTGGYHTDQLRQQLKLCRGFNYRSEFGDLSIRFLNLLGNTAWSVDHTIVSIAEELKERNISVGSYLAHERPSELDVPMPEHIVALPSDHPDRKDWRKARKRLHDYHNEMWRKAIRSVKSLQTAKEFLKYPRFYLSWSNDYRGRCYPQQAWLNPQTTEFEKSLIKLAGGCKLDERGLYWVKQAIGAAYLGTRLNLQDRVKWTEQNQHMLSQIASDPLSTVHLWEAAKEPWQFLQLCLEWHRVVVTKQQALWFIPIGADATASGLQILSSMLRDPVGMKFSNVLPPENPNDPPQDSYLEVLRVARELASAEPATQHLPQYMQSRSLGKTTMQMLYGATHYSVKQKVMAIFQSEGLLNNPVTWNECDVVAKLIEQASRVVFPAAYAALDWLQQLADKAAKSSPDEFVWSTPSNDTVKLREFKADVADIRTSHLGRVRVPISRDRILDMKSMKSALAPSFVHSYDAALLKIAFDGWTQPIAVIHDCMKALPTDMDAALNCIRKAFYAICQGDSLAELAESLGVSSEALPRLEQGDGDLEAVFDSIYLFN